LLRPLQGKQYQLVSGLFAKIPTGTPTVSDIVQRLREGIDPLDIPGAERAMDAGADEIERLRAALKPLAEAAKHYTPYHENMNDNQIDVIITLGQLRAAAAALEQKAAPEGECPDCGEPLATGNHKDDCSWWNNKAADK
jgi:hypothetical protein